jgi:hypothetical protein
MKVWTATTEDPLVSVFMQTLCHYYRVRRMGTHEEAEVIITNSSVQLHELYEKYGEGKFFVILDPTQVEIKTRREDNVFGAGLTQLVAGPQNICFEMTKKYRKWFVLGGLQ